MNKNRKVQVGMAGVLSSGNHVLSDSGLKIDQNSSQNSIPPSVQF